MTMRQRHVRNVVLVLALTWTATGHAQQTADALYQAALYQEEVQGDLEGAVEIYRRILDEFSDSRAVGAKAQLHMGLCYEKLGLQDALQAYQRVIDDYAEHRDEVTVARQRLASLAQVLAELNRQPTFRKVEIASKPQNGVLSPDGSKLAFVSEGGVWVVPLHGNVDPDIAGEPVRIADVPGVWDLGSMLTWSADGEWIAVNGGDDVYDRDVGTDAYVVPVGGGDARVMRLPNRGGGARSYRLSLSPDGQKLAFSALELERSEGESWRDRYIYVAPTGGGEPQQLSSSWGSNPTFSPDGELIAYVGYPERDTLLESTQPLRPIGDLWVVPSAGGAPVKLASVDGLLGGPVWSPDGRFIAAQGPTDPRARDDDEIWVYTLSPDASSAEEPTRIVLPRRSTALAGWTPQDELGVLIESERLLAIFTVPAFGGKAVQVAPHGIHYYPRWSPDGERIILRWVRLDEDPPVRMAYVPADGGDVVEVPWSGRPFMSRVPGGGHNVSPDGKSIVVSAFREPYRAGGEWGDVWTIPLDGSPPTRLTSDESQEGYPCWSPDGQWVAFTGWHEESEGDGFGAIYMVPAEGGETRRISSASDGVGPGAVAFSPDGERIAFFSNGAITTIPVEGGHPTVLVADVSSGWHSQLAYSPDGSRIAHNAGGKIWITQLDGGVPEELRTGLPEGANLSEFGWSPNGEKIVFMALIGGEPELWLISDFLPE